MPLQETTVLSKDSVLAERFEFVRTLGEGSAGAVFLVKDRSRGQEELALKLLTNPSAFDELTTERFRQEVAILQKLRHPNLIEAYDLIEFRGVFGYTMELVLGRDLGKIFVERRFDLQEIEEIISQVLSALQALHNHGIIHRDIKLENIMRRTDGIIKLTDLGLMKNVSQAKATQTGVLLGTAQYLPPEYVRSSQFDNRGDLYAVGIMMFELLSAKRRFAGRVGMQVLEELLQTDFALPMTLLHGIPEKFCRIIRKATLLDPKARYQTAEEMLNDFRAPVPSVTAPPQTIEPHIRMHNFGEQPKKRSAALPSWFWWGSGLLAIILLLGIYFRA